MKERIVIDNEDILFSCLHDYEDNVGVINYKLDRKKFEQVPESFADLLILCKNTKGCFVLRASDREYIEVPTDLIGYSFTFHKEGIFADEDVCVKEKATPQQMWNIIKSLIGEE